MIIMIITFFLIAIVLSMFGKGGGEFYLPILLSFGLPYQNSATMTLFILMISGTTMMIVFHKKALIDWATGVLIIIFSAAGAFLGGLISANINPAYLKLTFAVLLLVSAYFIAVPPQKKQKFQMGLMWARSCCGEQYSIPVFIVFPAIFIIGFIAGMVGISGGGLVVPLLLLIGNVPLRIAFATNSLLVLFSSALGFSGHIIHTSIDWRLTLFLAGSVVFGAIIGANLSSKMNLKHLKKIFIYILIIAAGWMILKIFM